jgi:hypothetical protein
MYLIKGISVISKEAILYAGTSNCSRKSTDEESKGEEKRVIPISFAFSNNFLCHSQGVYAC